MERSRKVSIFYRNLYPFAQNISLFAISSMTSLLWSIAQKQLVADTPLTMQLAENLASCLNSVLKAAAVTASEDSKSSFQQQVL